VMQSAECRLCDNRPVDPPISTLYLIYALGWLRNLQRVPARAEIVLRYRLRPGAACRLIRFINSRMNVLGCRHLRGPTRSYAQQPRPKQFRAIENTLDSDHGTCRDDKDRRSSSAVRWIGRSR
jgi:hypothetical protein